MYVPPYVRVFNTAVYIKSTLPIRHQKQATTASHNKCHKLGAGCCLDFSPDKEGGIFFATSKAPEKAKRGEDLRIHRTYIHSSLHTEYGVHTENILLGVIHIRTYVTVAPFHRPWLIA